MKLTFRIIFKITPILTIIIGCATTHPYQALVKQGKALSEKGRYDLASAYFNKALDIN